MNIPVLVEPVAANGFRARIGEPLSLMADGTTEQEALLNLGKMIEDRLSNGAKLVHLDVNPFKHPFAKYAGTWSPDDPVIQQWKQAVEDYRRQCDEDPDY